MRRSPYLAAFACLAVLASLSSLPLSASSALTVEHVPPTGVSTGEPIHLEVLVSADQPVKRVEILPTASNYFENFTLTLIHGTETYGVWAGDIPAQSAAGVLEYRIEVTRADDWTQDYDYNVTVSGGSSGGGIDLPDDKWVLFVAGVVILAIFFVLEIPLKRRLMDRLRRKDEMLQEKADGERRKARRVKKE